MCIGQLHFEAPCIEVYVCVRVFVWPEESVGFLKKPTICYTALHHYRPLLLAGNDDGDDPKGDANHPSAIITSPVAAVREGRGSSKQQVQ